MPHPLSDFVMSAFTEEKKYYDTTTIAAFLSGTSGIVRAKKGSEKNVMDAYRLVAEDVLGCLKGDGRLELNPRGWYVVTGA
jgi:hypothetical protein